MTTFPRIQPFGDSAIVVEFGEHISMAINSSVHALASLLEINKPAGVIEWVPSYAALTIYYDPLLMNYTEMVRWISEKTERLAEVQRMQPRVIEVPTIYGGEFGPDLDFVAQYHGLTAEEVIHIHSEREYHVFMLGFTPGFPYMGELSERIAAPRLAAPRLHVPAGSVGIAERQTGIYPIESPGGWHIIGRTSLMLFDVQREPPFLISAGDTVKFVPVMR